MRIFIGIQFQQEVKEYLNKVQDIIKQSSVKGNFTLFDNFHLTLRFIGDINQKEVDILSDILDDLSMKINSFTINIGDINSFNKNNKHIVYVDVLKNKDKLTYLANMLEEYIVESGFEKRKEKFKPHITIAREVIFNQVTVLNHVFQYDKEIEINSISIFLSSRNKNNILTYTPLYTVKLDNK